MSQLHVKEYRFHFQNCPLPLSSSKSRLCSRQTRTMEYRTLCFINVPNVYDVMLSRSEVQLHVLLTKYGGCLFTKLDTREI